MPITAEQIVFALTVFGVIAGVWWRIKTEIDTEFKAAAEDQKALRSELAEYKVFVARNHVSASTLRDTEERLITAIDKLGNRLEAIVARLDKMTR